MRPTRTALFLILCLLPVAGANAGTLTSATWVTQLNLGPIAPLPPISVPIAAAGNSTASSVSVSLSVPQFTFQTFIPAQLPTTMIDLHVLNTQCRAWPMPTWVFPAP
jgi:hypothetical protein